MRRAGVPCAPADVRAVYAALGTNVFELLWTAGRASESPLDRVEIDPVSWATVQPWLDTGRGLVVATAHTGNWDLIACAMAKRLPLTVVTKHLSWRSLDGFWQGLREEQGVRLVDPRGALSAVGAALRAGGVVAFMVDQAPERARGVARFPFLGAEAEHDLTFATIAARYRVPVAVVCGERRREGSHALHVLHIEEPPNRPSRAWVLRTAMTAAGRLDSFVREHPSQWLWLHRRWKRGQDNAPRKNTSTLQRARLEAS
jgi:KDO2-lipid IV(A) lauroyltransferase